MLYWIETLYHIWSFIILSIKYRDFFIHEWCTSYWIHEDMYMSNWHCVWKIYKHNSQCTMIIIDIYFAFEPYLHLHPWDEQHLPLFSNNSPIVVLRWEYSHIVPFAFKAQITFVALHPVLPTSQNLFNMIKEWGKYGVFDDGWIKIYWA